MKRFHIWLPGDECKKYSKSDISWNVSSPAIRDTEIWWCTLVVYHLYADRPSKISLRWSWFVESRCTDSIYVMWWKNPFKCFIIPWNKANKMVKIRLHASSQQEVQQSTSSVFKEVIKDRNYLSNFTEEVTDVTRNWGRPELLIMHPKEDSGWWQKKKRRNNKFSRFTESEDHLKLN